MAIVLIKSKKQQGPLFWGIVLVVVLVLAGVSLVTFFPQLLTNSQPPAPGASYDASEVTLNTSIMDSDKVKKLAPFVALETTFAYVVQDKEGSQIVGTISAASVASARGVLEDSGFKVISLKEVNTGRPEPFISY